MRTSHVRAAAAPVRGTQSFVSVMAEVWKRPALTLLEMSWRSAFWLLFFGALALLLPSPLQRAFITIQASVGSMSAASISTVAQECAGLLLQIVPQLSVACIVWIALSAWGRGKVLRRLSPGVRPKFLPLLVISALRVVSFLAVLAFWLWAVVRLSQRMVLAPQSHDGEPAMVPFAAIVICGTLALFVLWMAASYVFQIAPVTSVEKHLPALASLRQELRAGILRSKLIEVNLVIGIIKIALLVLALVFSACPLPFSSVETQEFLTCWWIGVGIWYAIASDFVHVVRTAAFLRLWQVYENPLQASTPAAESAL